MENELFGIYVEFVLQTGLDFPKSLVVKLLFKLRLTLSIIDSFSDVWLDRPHNMLSPSPA